MADRRSMQHALVLTPEQGSFIHNGRSPEMPPPPAQEEAQACPASTSSISTDLPAPSLGREHRPGPENPAPPVLVPLTTRLHPHTAEALRRAHLENKLRRIQPCSQQEIVEHALRVWLVEHKFL